HPLVDPGEVEVRRADEIDGPLVAVEEQADVGNRGQLLHRSPPSCAGTRLALAFQAAIIEASLGSPGFRDPYWRRVPRDDVRRFLQRFVGENAESQLGPVAVYFARIERLDEGEDLPAD